MFIAKFLALLAEGFNGTVSNLHEGVVCGVVELVLGGGGYHAGVDWCVGGGRVAAAAVHGEAAPQAAARRAVLRPGRATAVLHSTF